MSPSAAPQPAVVIVSEFTDATKNSTGYYWDAIIRGLAGAGRTVRVVTMQASADAAGATGRKALGVEYVPCRDSAYSKASTLSRLGGQILIAWRLLRALVRTAKRGDIVLSGTNPAFLLVFVALLRPLLEIRWVLLVHDVFPENLVPAGLVSPGSLRFAVARRIFAAAYRRADALLAIGRDMAELLAEKTGQPGRIHLVPNWVDLDALSDAPRAAYGGKDVVFQFFGNLGRVQGLDLVLAAAERVRRDDASLHLIGSGAMEATVRQFVAAHPELRVRLDPPVPMSRNHEVLQGCDVAIVALAPGMRGLGVPSKAYFSMAADKPLLVVGDEGSELHRLISENPEAGWFCRAGEVDALAAVIDSIDRAELDRRRGYARKLVEAQFAQPQATARILRVLDDVQRSGAT